ncbi:voltage-gated potassium channel protein [Phanerochaete sordida]|uniref:Voltage-gated potassium channel protein n=1 Tax=Phanerochaete sordida TaxID=48140 RepID=A0A9P3G1P7_9APHY|nr:voltage-gated potassium channel protein [Phanerochaete sordida]
MGLPVILSALHLSSVIQPRRRQRDPEEGIQEKDGRDETENGHTDAGDLETNADDDVDDDSYDPLNDPSRRLHRLGSATEDTFFSSTINRSLTNATSVSTKRPWYTKVRDYVFPPEESASALEKFVPNYRWTPIISGVVVPFALLLEIPGLTEHWYIRTEAGQVVDRKSNSAILDVALGFSMACGLFANICLILRFLEIRVKTVTILTMSFLTLHDLINIVTVTVFGVQHRFDDGFTYGQSFWMTVCSTIASTITNVTIITDYYQTAEFARSGSGLTRRQRALVIIVMLLLVYIAFGALVNSFLLSLNFIDALYFTVVTIETIGFGDITPINTGSRVFTCFYMAFGILLVGIAVAMTRETVLEGLELGYRKRLRNLQLRRREARRFRHWEARWRRAIVWRLKAAGKPIWVPDGQAPHEEVRFVGLTGDRDGAGEVHWMRRWLNAIGLERLSAARAHRKHVRGHPRGKHLNLDALNPQQLEAAALEAGVPLEMFLSPPRGRPEAELERQHSNASSERSARRGEARRRLFWYHRHPDTDGWPTYPQTPTHAQVGRMSAMVTKFAMAVTGTHIHMLGHSPETHPSQQMQAEADRDAAPNQDPVFFDEKRPHDGQAEHFEERSDPQNSEAGPEESNGHAEKAQTDSDTERREDANGKVHTGGAKDPQIPAKGLVVPGSLHPNVPGWAKDLATGRNTKMDILYENLKEDLEAEENKAYYAKLSVAWTLFLLFWLVGSAIFSATEGWTYGDTMYFCFLAFTTTGYGDFAPVTPAGRSVFVVWALMGVATMTILISVIEDAMSSRYKSVLHSKTFDAAVKKFREHENQQTEALARKTTPRAPRAHQSTASLLEAAKRADDAARQELEKLPTEIIRRVRAFHDQMQFFVNSGTTVAEEAVAQEAQSQSRIPKQLRKLLDEIAELEDIGERAKREILEDDDSRNTLLMLSIERTLRRLINSAETSLAALAERDSLNAEKEHHVQKEHGFRDDDEPMQDKPTQDIEQTDH